MEKLEKLSTGIEFLEKLKEFCWEKGIFSNHLMRLIMIKVSDTSAFD